MDFRFLVLALVTVFFLSPTQAAAYIGPGAGLGSLAVLLALVLGVVLLFVGFVWFPVKRMLRKRRERAHGETQKPRS